MSEIAEWKKARKRSISNREFLVAVSDNDVGEMSRLLEIGIDINFKDADGYTPLSLASEYSNAKTVQFLLDKGARLNIENGNRETPLGIAERCHRHEIIKIFEALNSPNFQLKSSDECLLRNAAGSLKPLLNQMDNTVQSSIEPNQNISWNNAVHGNIYQLKVLMLFLYRGVTCEYSFKLGTEVKEARKFDDLVFEYTQDNTKVYRLLQAKHKIDETKKITADKLLSEANGDYSLITYFNSYQACKRDDFFKDGLIKDVTICTNIDFDFDNLKKSKIEIVKLVEKDDILDVESKSKNPTRYKFTKSMISKLRHKLQYKKFNSTSNLLDIEIEDFLQHLVFAVNQPNEAELGDIIKKEIGREADSSATENMYNKFFIRMLDCFKDRSNFMTFNEGKELFEEFKKSLFIWFNVHEPVKSFTGRSELMKNIHEFLQVQESRLLCVSGLGGVGKSELVKKYISEYSQYYDNKIIWINAESYQTLVNSFRQLASDKLGISTTNADGKDKDVNSVISQVYQYFSKSKSLFILDNAEMYRSRNKFDPGISQFLPNLPSGCNKPYIIITSRNQKWPESVKIQILDGFTQIEAVAFISQNLHLKNDKQKEHAEQLGLKLQLLPLALQQAIAYIKSQNEELGEIEKGFQISDYLERFMGKSEEILNFEFPDYSDNRYSKTVFTTWNVTLDAIKRKENGYDALNLLNFIAYLLPNDISEETLYGFIQSKEKLKSSCDLLEQYSLIDKQNEMFHVHRLVQQVTRIKLVEKSQEIEILERCLDAFDRQMNSKNVGHLVSVWTYCQKYPALLKRNVRQLSNLVNELVSCGRNEEARAIGILLSEILQESSSTDLKSQVILSTIKNNNSGALIGQGKYEEALKELKENYEASKTLRGSYNDHTLLVKSNIAGVLHKLGRNDEAFECYKELFKDCKIHLGEDHYQTVSIKSDVANFLIDKGNYNEALPMLQEAHSKLETMLGSNHVKTWTVKHNIACALHSLEKYEEALKMYEEIYDIQKKNLVENHPEILDTRSSIAGALYHLGQKKSALDIYTDLFNIYTKMFGENHPNTIETHGEMAYVLVGLNKMQAALKIFKEVIMKQKKIFGLHHPHVERTLSGLGCILETQGKTTESLKVHEELLRCQLSLFGGNDVRTLKPRTVICSALMNDEKYDAALKQYSEMYQIQKESFGTNDPQTLMSKHQIGMIYFFKQQYDKAFNILTEVCKAQEAVLGKNDAVCVNTRHNIAQTVMARQMYRLKCDDLNAYEKLRKDTTGTNTKDGSEWVLFHQAVQSGSTISVNFQHKVQLNLPPSTIENPLKAVQSNELSVLEKLLKGGADINTSDVNKGTLLHHAVNLGLMKIIKFLLKNGADVTCTTVKGNTPLHMATSKGEFEIVETLLDNVDHAKLKEFIDVKTFKSGSAALHIAAKNGFLEIARYLLMRSATYDLKNNDGQSPADLAIDRYVKDMLKNVDKHFELANTGKEELVNMLKQYTVEEYLAGVNARNGEGNNLMQVAVLKNDRQLVDLLHGLSRKEFISIYSSSIPNINLDEFLSLANSAFAATQFASYSLDQVLDRVSDFLQMFRAHYNCVSNPNIAVIEDMLLLLNSFTSTRTFVKLAKHVVALHLVQFIISIYSTKFLEAAKSNNLAEFEKLIASERVNVNVKENGGWTPLHYATNVSNEKMVEMLLSKGAQVNCVTNTGKFTPLHIAINKKNVDIVKHLLRWHSSIELVDAKTEAKGSTALHIAVKNGQYKIVQLLFAHCANYQVKNKDDQAPVDLIDKEDIRGLFKFTDELFDDVKDGKIGVIKKLKALSPGMLFTVVRVRNYDGCTLMEIAALNKHSEILNQIRQMVEMIIIQARDSKDNFHDLRFY